MLVKISGTRAENPLPLLKFCAEVSRLQASQGRFFNVSQQNTLVPEQSASEASAAIQPYRFNWKEVAWTPFLFITSVHILALAGFFTFSWPALFLCLVLHWVSGGVGITLTYHRLLTHKSFTVPKPVEYALAVIATLACQGGPLSWVAAHRVHHTKSDLEGDPHSPRRGFFWAHMMWCVTRNDQLDGFECYAKHAPDLAKDRFYYWLEKLHMLPTAILAAGLYLWGGWSFVVWGIFVRLVLVYHSTWFVNSAAHVWGYKTYDSRDDSRNLWWVALVTYGEGWHNNHHAFQNSARHGLAWWEFDTTYLTIRVLELLGLAKAVKVPTQDLLRKKNAA